MATASGATKHLEDFPQDDIPQQLLPLSRVSIELMESILLNSKHITEFQKQYAWQYTVCCLDKGACLRGPLAALAYSYQLANRNRSEKESANLKRLTAAVRSLPAEQVAKFKAQVEQFMAPPQPFVVPGLTDAEPDGEGSGLLTPSQKLQDCIFGMQDCLKGTGKQPVVNYDEAVSQARTAIGLYPDNPDVLLQAAVCYKTRAAREKDLPLELRIQDMQKAIDLMERFLKLSVRAENRELPQYKSRRGLIAAQVTAMRESLAEGERKMQKKKKKDD
jgi:hypothetical protein